MKEKDQINIIQEENKADLKSDLNNLRLTCPECDLIPALFFDIKSRNIYQISAACENKHTITNTPVKQFYEKYMKIKQSSSDSIKTSFARNIMLIIIVFVNLVKKIFAKNAQTLSIKTILLLNILNCYQQMKK